MHAQLRLSLAVGLALLLLGASPALAILSRTDPVFARGTSSIHHVEARLHLDAQRTELALESLTRALHDRPDDLETAVKLADLHYRARRYAKSVDILRDYVDRASVRRNVFYYLALSFDRLDDFRNALGYYYKALTLDPRLLKAYVRIARVRVRQGLVFDATRALKKCLEINPDYFPALQELRVVNRLVRLNAENVYRKDNVVVLFPDSKLYGAVDALYPRIQRTIEFLERNLKYHVPEVWVKVVGKVPRFENPPAFYDHPEGCVYLEVEAVKTGEATALIHELTYLYLRRMGKNNCPSWLAEGLALFVSRPSVLADTPLRSLRDRDLDFRRTFSPEKSYLRWETTTEESRKALLRAFLCVRFLLDSYGWPAMRKVLAAYRDGASSFEKVCWDVLHVDFESLRRRWDVYAVSNYYFSPVQVKTAP